MLTIGEGAEIGHARVVHQRIDAGACLGHMGGHLIDLAGLRDIADHRVHALQRGGGLLQRGRVAVDHHHAPALAQKGARAGQADTARGPGDNGGFRVGGGHGAAPFADLRASCPRPGAGQAPRPSLLDRRLPAR
jgi:hypothetical protein